MERDLAEYRYIKALIALPFVEAIWLFGSRARGTAAERSDVDLAIHCRGDADWAAVTEIIEDADTLLHIDAIRFDTLPLESELRASILRCHQVLFSRVPA